MAAELALSADQARTLTDRIKIAVEGTWQMIQEAYTSRAWAALGYDTWDAYCTAEFGTSRLRLPREERQEVVASLRESGLSTRAIASATGMDQKTVRNDLAASGEDFSSPVVGADGKTYAARTEQQPDADLIAGDDWQPTESPSAPDQKQKRRPLTDAFATAVVDLTRAAERLERLTADDRFSRNLDATRRHTPELLGALERTADLIGALDLPAAEANEEARRWWATSLNKISSALTGAAQSIDQEK